MMNQMESEERVIEGLKKAASCARQMAQAQKNKNWLALAIQFDRMLETAKELIRRPSITQAAADAMIDEMIAKKVIAEESGKIH